MHMFAKISLLYKACRILVYIKIQLKTYLVTHAEKRSAKWNPKSI